jgi:ligand-binding SRPBCC domain-containing protein
MTVSFECVTRSSSWSAAELFDRARDVEAHLSSMEHSGERAVGGVQRGLIGPGEHVTWKGRHLGIPFTLTSAVTEFDRPHRFVDEQQRGPFAAFRHEHLFDDEETGSRMIDRVTFTAPLGVLGRFAERAVLARYLRRLIEQRGEWLAAP